LQLSRAPAEGVLGWLAFGNFSLTQVPNLFPPPNPSFLHLKLNIKIKTGPKYFVYLALPEALGEVLNNNDDKSKNNKL
jgi:hypothetical protein